MLIIVYCTFYYSVNQIDMCSIDTNNDNICDINFKSSICSNLLLKQNMDVIDESHKFTPSPFKTTSKFWLLIIKMYYAQLKLKLYYVIYTIF